MNTQRPDQQAQRVDTGNKDVTHKPEISLQDETAIAPNQQSENALQEIVIPESKVKELAEDLQGTLDEAAQDQYHVGFRMDSRTDSYVIEISDKEGELVKQFPPEKVLNLQGKMDELSGMVVDEMT